MKNSQVSRIQAQKKFPAPVSRKDFISNLPHSLVEIILTKLPIRDAVKTSVLSTKWRHRWSTMTQLVFDENCMRVPPGSTDNQEKLFNFIMRCLFLHDGPINKFRLYTSYSYMYPDIDQCLLFLSRKHIKELVLHIKLFHPILPVSSAIFSCQQLTSLTLCGFEVKPPLTFQGFPCLKYLDLDFDIVTREVVEKLISGCPLLEKLKFTNFEHIAFSVRASNLKHLTLDGNFEHVYLEHAPLLESISIEIDTEASEGDTLLTVPVTYHCLKFMELKSINFKEMNEVLYVLHLILQSPNVQELQMSALAVGCAFEKAADKDFWERESPTDFMFKHLKIVKISGVSNKKDMEYIKFLLGRSPVLEVMRLSHDDKYNNYIKKLRLENIVLQFQRASPKVDIKFLDSSS